MGAWAPEESTSCATLLAALYYGCWADIRCLEVVDVQFMCHVV